MSNNRYTKSVPATSNVSSSSTIRGSRYDDLDLGEEDRELLIEQEFEKEINEEGNENEEARMPTGKSNNDVDELIHWLKSERAVEEILPFASQLVFKIKQRIDNQQEVLDGYIDKDDASFVKKIYLMELERVKYVLHSYLRVRLFKIQQFTHHILQSSIYCSRLSPSELDYAKKYLNLKSAHFTENVLRYLPEQFQDMVDQSGSVDMVRSFNPNQFSLFKVKNDIGNVTIGSTNPPTDINLTKGQIVAILYDPVKAFVADGDLEAL